VSRRIPPLVLLLPPSEGKAAGGTGNPWSPDDGRFGTTLARRRTDVVKALKKAKGGDQRLLGVGGAHLDRAREANRTLVGSPTLPAGERYTGVVWDHLGLATLPASARRRATGAIVVVSGLLGLAAVDDPVPDYRLKMGASLPPLGKVSTWWRDLLSATLNEALDGCFVVDLLPNEHRAAWTPAPDRYAGGVSVTFVERTGKVAGHDAKAAKGRLARHLLTSSGHPERAIGSWTDDRFDLRTTPLG
jgi:cytoplasmic iron level regulating protein YaaA (DUF328/UPF0246 family)